MKADAMAKAKGAYRKQFKNKPANSNVRNLTDTTSAEAVDKPASLQVYGE
jgi:hypothetical protein